MQNFNKLDYSSDILSLIEQANNPGCDVVKFSSSLDTQDVLELDCGESLADYQLAYTSCGELNSTASNCILVFHALTGDQYFANEHPISKKPGWWHYLVGSGKEIDTDKYFVICANALGSCMGSTGPLSYRSPRLSDTLSSSPKLWGHNFPKVSLFDNARAVRKLLYKLGIVNIYAVLGGSMGGMLALSWLGLYHKQTHKAVIIASAKKHDSQKIALHTVGRQAILSDASYDDGRYTEGYKIPSRGLAIARMLAHITYLSSKGMEQKFGRLRQEHDTLESSPAESHEFSEDKKHEFSEDKKHDFSVQKYLAYQGKSFIKRFDANSYLSLTWAMDEFDMEDYFGAPLDKIFAGIKTKILLLSFDSDWLFNSGNSLEMVSDFSKAGAEISYLCLASPNGHDSFLIPHKEFSDSLANFLKSGLTNADKKAIDIKLKQRLSNDYLISAIPNWSKVLEIGADDGYLLSYLNEHKGTHSLGIESRESSAISSINFAVNTLCGDAFSLLDVISESKFEYIILSHTLQAINDPKQLLKKILGISKHVFVSFPNFGYWRVRLSLLASGRMPMTYNLSQKWYETDNIHLCTVYDFLDLCDELSADILSLTVFSKGKATKVNLSNRLIKAKCNLLNYDCLAHISLKTNGDSSR